MLYSDRSFRTISVTLAVDGILFVLTLVIGIFSKSKAVVSESLYQISDLVSGALLLYAIYSSMRPPDVRHPFGYGLDRFFWSFVSGVFVFAVNGAISVFLGALNYFREPPRDLTYAYAVLAATLLVSFVSLTYIRRNEAKGSGKVEHFHQGVRTVLVQDIMSIVSSLIALFALFLYSLYHRNFFDTYASEINGILLMATGIVLSSESRELLIGRGLSQDQLQKLSSLISSHRSIQSIRELKTMYLGPDSLMLVLRLNFSDGLSTDDIERTIDQLQNMLRSEIPELKHVIVEPES
jgi:cation diffusion facilitator family transporter